MADLNLNDQPTATDADSIILAVQENNAQGNKVWRKLTPPEMIALFAIGGLTDAQERLLASLPAYLNDLLLVSQEVWSTATDMQLVSLDPNDAGDTRNIQLLAAGSVPTLSGWAAEITTTQNEVIVARIPLAMNAEDYRIQEVRSSGTTSERLQNIPERARNSQYKFISTLNAEIAAAFTAQHHGINHHTEFDGTLGDRPTAEVQALIDALATAIMARLLPDPSGSTAGFVPKVNSALNGFILGADETAAGGGSLSPQQLARLLPDPTGSTAGFVAKVNAALNGYVLAAESGGAALTAAQLAKLAAIATPPAEGARNMKGLIYDGDRTAWEIFDYLTRAEFRDYRPHTPDRGDTLPVHLLPQGTFVLQKTSHWSDKFYRFYPVSREITVGGQSVRDAGTIEVPLSSDWTVFESTDNANPAIFSATRVAGIVMRTFPVNMAGGVRWYPKIILDRALFPSDQGVYDFSGLSIRMRTDFGSHFDTQLFKTSFDTDDSTGTVQEIVAGGKTYVCFRPNPLTIDSRLIFDNAATNDASLSFQILKSASASPVFPPTDPQFLSDDPATAWVDGDQFETGLYEGDANGHPQARILPPIDAWNQVLARTNTIFSGTTPDARAGVDGQFWVNLRTGQIWQKQSGTWTGIADLVLQTELTAAIDAIEASGGADGKMIWGDGNRPADNLGKVGDSYIRRLTGALGFYEKTATTTWTYRYEILVLQGRPPLNRRDGMVAVWNGNTYEWGEIPVRYAEFTVNSNISLPNTAAGAAVAMTYASRLAKSNENTGFIDRNANGNQITLAAGSYRIDTYLLINQSSDFGERSTWEVDIFGTASIDKKTNLIYLRGDQDLQPQALVSNHTFTVASTTNIQVRVGISDIETGAGSSSIVFRTAAGSSVTVTRL